MRLIAAVSGFTLALLLGAVYAHPFAPSQPKLGNRSVRLLHVGTLQFKDFNRNRKLDAFEDWRKTPQERAKDLVARMPVEDLAGILVHGTLAARSGPNAAIGIGSDYDFERAKELIARRRINTFITRLDADPVHLAESANMLQEIAESTSFGIPLVISTDPRNHFQYVPGASVRSRSFSQWPETTGLAAINDPALTRHFAEIVRKEYLAVGIRESLSPQADLATEPRWPRINGTFGEDPEVAKEQVEATVEGLQDGNTGLKTTSVIAVVKHWVGYGAQKLGWDSHNFYGRFSALTDRQLMAHIIPFLGAFDAHVADVMPTYSILEKLTLNGDHIEQVGAGFNTELLTYLLRKKHDFNGVVLSDWAITNDCGETCRNGVPEGQEPGPREVAMSWGVIDMPLPDRFAKAINAGVDQIGGTDDVEPLLEAFRSKRLSESRMREAAERILEQKFALGLFEDPYVNATAARTVVGDAASVKAGEAAQQRAMVPLENKLGRVPLKRGDNVWLFDVNPSVAVTRGLRVVDSPERAKVAIIRAAAPFETIHKGYFFGLRQHEGRLDFRKGDAAYDALLTCGKTPVIMTVYLDRPAILTQVREKVAVLYADFGINDGALLDVLLGESKAGGHLPFELPSSMEAVEAQQSDVPHDSAHPLYSSKYAFK